MEGPSSPECAHIIGHHNVGNTVCNGIGMDGLREHRHVREGSPWCRSSGSCAFLLGTPTLSATDDRTATVVEGRRKGAGLCSRTRNNPWKYRVGVSSNTTFTLPKVAHSIARQTS